MPKKKPCTRFGATAEHGPPALVVPAAAFLMIPAAVLAAAGAMCVMPAAPPPSSPHQLPASLLPHNSPCLLSPQGLPLSPSTPHLERMSSPPQSVPPPAGQAVDGWFPWETEVGTMDSGLSQAEFDAVLAKRAAVETILRRSGALTRGAEVLPSWYVGRLKEADSPEPVRFGISLMIFRPSRAEARTSAGHISIRVNAPLAAAGEFLFADAEGPIYRERPVAGHAGGGEFVLHRLSGTRDVTQQTGWIIAPDDRPVWLPVSRERWIRALIGDAREKLETFEEEARAGARDRRERFEKMYEGMKRISAENAEELRRQHEAREDGFARIAESLAAGDADALETLGRRDLAMYLRTVSRLEQELAAMSAGERASPAYCCESAPSAYFAPPSTATRPSLLVEPGDARARPLLAPNPAFFRRDPPPTAMQSVTVIQSLTRTDAGWEAYMEAVRTEVDWAAVKALLQ